VQNGVLSARKEIPDSVLAHKVLDTAVKVVADEFSLRERGIMDADRHEKVSSGSIDDLVDLALAEGGTKVMWH